MHADFLFQLDPFALFGRVRLPPLPSGRYSRYQGTLKTRNINCLNVFGFHPRQFSSFSCGYANRVFGRWTKLMFLKLGLLFVVPKG